MLKNLYINMLLFIVIFYVGNFLSYIQFQDKNKLIKSSEVSNEFKTLSNNFKKNKSENRVYFHQNFIKISIL